MLRHLITIDEIWVSKILKFDFQENEKGFWIEIETFFLVSQVLSIRVKKQSSGHNLQMPILCSLGTTTGFSTVIVSLMR